MDWHPPTEKRGRNVALFQGAYYVASGLWPIVSIGSFQWVTGKKRDLWLVKTAGVLIATIGSVLALASRRDRTTPEIYTLGILSAAGIAGIDVVYYFRGLLRWVYLAESLLEAGIIAGWISGLARRGDG